MQKFVRLRRPRSTAKCLHLAFAADVEFSAVVDPNLKLAEARIEALKKGAEHGNKWANAKAFKSYTEMLASPVSLPVDWTLQTFTYSGARAEHTRVRELNYASRVGEARCGFRGSSAAVSRLAHRSQGRHRTSVGQGTAKIRFSNEIQRQYYGLQNPPLTADLCSRPNCIFS